MSPENLPPLVVASPSKASPSKGRARASVGGAAGVHVGSPASLEVSSERLASAMRRGSGHAPLVLAGLAVAIVGSALLAEGWFVASRLAYVGFVGLALRAESRNGALSRREGPEAAWRRFRARAERLMFGDVIAFVALCVVTRGTFVLPGPSWLGPAAGLLGIVLGIGTKLWATASLDQGTFYWRDFFVPAEHRVRSAGGPYRWLSNPMYSVGYAHAYGFALLLGSGPGLVGAAFAQLGVTLLAVLVERPHVRRFGAG